MLLHLCPAEYAVMHSMLLLLLLLLLMMMMMMMVAPPPLAAAGCGWRRLVQLVQLRLSRVTY